MQQGRKPGRAARRERVARVAFGICTLLLGFAAVLSMTAPAGIDLGQALLMVEPSILMWIQQHVPAGVWAGMVAPVLVRPVWLLPAMLGLVAGAVAWSARISAGR